MPPRTVHFEQIYMKLGRPIVSTVPYLSFKIYFLSHRSSSKTSHLNLFFLRRYLSRQIKGLIQRYKKIEIYIKMKLWKVVPSSFESGKNEKIFVACHGLASAKSRLQDSTFIVSKESITNLCTCYITCKHVLPAELSAELPRVYTLFMFYTFTSG